MDQVLHGSATTTKAIRQAIQRSQAGLRVLAKRYEMNPKTVAKWKMGGSAADLAAAQRAQVSSFFRMTQSSALKRSEISSPLRTRAPARFGSSTMSRPSGLSITQ